MADVAEKLITAEELKYVHDKLRAYDKLLCEEIPDTVQSYIFDDDGTIEQVTHTSGTTIIRTDAFTFEDSTVTEVRTLNTGESLEIETDLDTLETTVTYTAAS